MFVSFAVELPSDKSDVAERSIIIVACEGEKEIKWTQREMLTQF